MRELLNELIINITIDRTNDVNLMVIVKNKAITITQFIMCNKIEQATLLCVTCLEKSVLCMDNGAMECCSFENHFM